MPTTLPPQKNEKADIVFCLSSYNDIDHIVPVIYRLTKDYEWLKIKCVVFDIHNNYKNDFRIQLIKSLGIDVDHLAYMLGLPHTSVDQYFARVLLKKTRFLDKISLILSNKLIYNTINQTILNAHNLLQPSYFFNRIFDVEKSGILIFDHQVNIAYSKLAQYAKHNKFISVSIPHAPVFGTACNMRSWSIEECPFEKVNPYPYDYIIHANYIQKINMAKTGLSINAQNIVLGSARFCKEWNDKIHQITPKFSVPTLPRNTLKIVLMATKPEGRLYKDELDRIIRFICRFPDVFLIIKSHTRGEHYEISKIKNLAIVGNEIHSSALIEWADLTFFTHSSVVLDNIQEDKPVLFLQRVIQDRMAHESVKMSWEVRCQEELRDYMWQFIHNRNSRTYTKEERKNCLNTFVEPEGNDVLGNYSNFLINLSKQINSKT